MKFKNTKTVIKIIIKYYTNKRAHNTIIFLNIILLKVLIYIKDTIHSILDPSMLLTPYKRSGILRWELDEENVANT